MPIAPHSPDHRAVVDERDERRGDELALLAAVDAAALGDEIGLETVTARLVEQHAAAAVLDDDRQRTAGRGAGVELGDRLRAASRASSSTLTRSNSSKPIVWPMLWYPVCMPVSPSATTLIRTNARTCSSATNTPSVLATSICLRLSP